MGKRKRGAKDPSSAPSNSKPPAAKRAKITSLSLDKTQPFAESPTPEDRKQEAALYELLGSEDPADRLDAAECIVARLLGDSSERAGKDAHSPEAALARHLEKRLIRGLASGRNAARLGFSLALTEVLRQLFGVDPKRTKTLQQKHYPGLTFERVLKSLEEKTRPAGNFAGQEERDHFFGRLFGLECFVEAGVLFEDPSRWNAALDLAVALASKKSWLRPQCGWLVVQAVGRMQKGDERLAEATLKRIADTNLARSPEGLAIWIAATDKFAGLSVMPWGGNPLSLKNLLQLSTVLREQAKDDTKEQTATAAKGSMWSAQLHFVWNLIIDHFLAGGESRLDAFQKFWISVVDDGLFSKTATDGQKYRGFMILPVALPACGENVPGFLFSPKLMACLKNQAAREDRYLHRAALKALGSVGTAVATHPSCAPAVLGSLVGEHGDYAFDSRTNTKTVAGILSHVDQATEKRVVQLLRKLAVLPKQDAETTATRVKTYVEYLARLVVSRPPEAAPAATALQELCRLAYSSPAHIPAETLTDQTRGHCRTRLGTVFAKLIRRVEDFGFLCHAILAIEPDGVKWGKQIKKRLDAARRRMAALVPPPSSPSSGALDKGGSTADPRTGLALLHAAALLQLYNQEPDAIEILDDVEKCGAGPGPADGEEADAGESVSRLIGILLSLVAHPSALMRQVSRKVFGGFTGQMTSGSLQQLTDPLDCEENAGGLKELFHTEADDEMDVDDISGDEGDDGADAVRAVDFSDLDGAEVPEVDSGDEGSSEEEDEDDGGENEDDDGDAEEDDDDTDDGNDSDDDNDADDGGDDDGLAALDDALEKVLNSHRLDKDRDAASSSSESDMSDSEMLAIDEKLATAFQQRMRHQAKNTKKEKKDARATVVNFKRRVLDLLDIFACNEAATAGPLGLQVLLPLLRLARRTSDTSLSAAAGAILQNYLKALRKARQNSSGEPEAQVHQKKALETLAEIHTEAGRNQAHSFARMASCASLIVASVLCTADRRSAEHVVRVYADTQLRWVLGDVKIQPVFFTEWLNWCQSHAGVK